MQDYIWGNILITLFIIAVLTVYFVFWSKSKTEQFSQQNLTIAKHILQLFKQTPQPSFIVYLEKLISLNNTSDNLISKSVYNNFINNSNLTLIDIMNVI